MTRFIFTIALVLAFAPIAKGAIIYELFFRTAQGDGLDTVINVAAGESLVGVEAILRETVTDGSASLFAASNVNAFNALITTAGADGSFNTKVTDATGGFPAGSDNASQYNFSAFGPFFMQPSREASDLGGGVREFGLGTVTLLAPTVGSTTFTLSDATNDDGDFTTFNSPAGLETISVASGGGFFGRSVTLQVTAIPEPSSLAFLAITSVGLMTTRRRRR